MTRICIPIKAKNIASLAKMIGHAGRRADMLEIWVDSLPEKIRAKEILAITCKPLVIVNKGKKEKGDFKGTERQRIMRLADFAEAGADYIDLAAETPGELLKIIKRAAGKRASRKRTKIILSYHDFKKTPSLARLKELRDKAFKAGAHIFKAAVFAQTYEDNLTILRFLAESRRAGKPVIAHCMGEKGRISRLLAPVFGSYIIYAAADKKSATAPGQFTRDEYEKISSLLKL